MCYVLPGINRVYPDGLDQDCDDDGTGVGIDENDGILDKTCTSGGFIRVNRSALQSACNSYCGVSGTLTCTTEDSTVATVYTSYNFSSCAQANATSNSFPKCVLWSGTSDSATCDCPLILR